MAGVQIAFKSRGDNKVSMRNNTLLSSIHIDLMGETSLHLTNLRGSKSKFSNLGRTVAPSPLYLHPWYIV